jgi:diguanylate cyclase (GGDEF)-like protein
MKLKRLRDATQGWAAPVPFATATFLPGQTVWLLKATGRANRLLVTCWAVCLALGWWHRTGLWHWGDLLGLLGTTVATVGVVLAGASNIGFLRLLKRQGQRMEEGWLSNASYQILPVATWLITAVVWVVSGQLAAFVLMLIPIWEAFWLQAWRPALGLTVLTMFLAGVGHADLWATPIGWQLAAAMGLGGLCGSYLCYRFGLSFSRLYEKVQQLQALATTDVLTGLVNRRAFNLRLSNELARARRHKTPVTLALIDLDFFKRVNDEHGHPMGDRLLRELGDLLQKNIREHDIAARYGGEEFALVLPETREPEARELLERLRVLASQHVFCLPELPITLTLSVGLAAWSADEDAAELIQLADNALYQAKRLGRNRVVSSPRRAAGSNAGLPVMMETSTL